MQLCQIHFYQKIARKKVARVNAALRRHFWYLTEELIPFALCSADLQDHFKQNLAAKIFRVISRFQSNHVSAKASFSSNIRKKIQNLKAWLVKDLLYIIFQRLKFSVEDVQFLRYSNKRWNDLKVFVTSKN